MLFSTTAHPLTRLPDELPRPNRSAFDIVARIAERAPELRSAERKVAALILDDLTGASRASIGALAEKAEVSIATVTRFAKAVGCADVRELKLRLAQAAAVGQRFLQARTRRPCPIRSPRASSRKCRRRSRTIRARCAPRRSPQPPTRSPRPR